METAPPSAKDALSECCATKQFRNRKLTILANDIPKHKIKVLFALLDLFLAVRMYSYFETSLFISNSNNLLSQEVVKFINQINIYFKRNNFILQ